MSKDDLGAGFPAPPLSQRPTFDELVEALREVRRYLPVAYDVPRYQSELESIDMVVEDILKRLDG